MLTVLILIHALLSTLTRGSEYYVKNNPSSSYQCADNSTTCHMYCDQPQHGNINSYRCGRAVNCHFHCDQTTCGQSATIYGDNATNLYITQNSTGTQCFQNAMIYTPNNGNAYFSTNSLQGFQSMTVKSGSNAKEIIIDCNSPQHVADDCKSMNVDAATAEYLHIIIGNQLEFTNATVQCPVHSNLNESPCIIDASDGVMRDILIVAPDGIPQGVYVPNCPSCDSSVRMQCPNVDAVSVSVYPFTKNSECWWTYTPTMEPTINPTLKPTLSPVPSNNPTVAPSNHPTSSPTFVPSTNPTITPSNNPTFAPSYDPTIIPSRNPTFAPSNDPTIAPSTDPTVAPTIAPSNDPTIAPSNDPTIAPSNDPTIAPSNDPTIAPSTDPTITPSTVTTTQWTCNTECSDKALHSIQIQVMFSFADYVVYNLLEIECFLHQIFVEWLESYDVIRSFEPCDILIIDVRGGHENEQSCIQPPCIDYNNKETEIDGNNTITIIAKNAETTKALESVSLQSGEQRLATRYLDQFSLVMAVYIQVEPESQQNDANKPLVELNPIYYGAIALCALICCLVCFVGYNCIQKRGTKEESVAENAMEQNKLHPQGKGKRMTVSVNTVDYGGSGGQRHTFTESKVGRASIKSSVDMELMTVNKINRILNPKGARKITDSRTETKDPAFLPDTPYNKNPYNEYLNAEDSEYQYKTHQNIQKVSLDDDESSHDEDDVNMRLESDQTQLLSQRNETAEVSEMTTGSSWKTTHPQTFSTQQVLHLGFSEKKTNGNRKVTDSIDETFRNMVVATTPIEPITTLGILEDINEP